jgi:hypothetical protein
MSRPRLSASNAPDAVQLHPDGLEVRSDLLGALADGLQAVLKLALAPSPGRCRSGDVSLKTLL